MEKETSKQERIKYVDWGVANVFLDGTIELHKDLKLPQYDLLRKKILDHERDHDFAKGFWHNLQVDLFHFVSSSGLLQFMISRPKTWIQMLPIYYNKERGIIYDKNMIVFYSIILTAIIITIAKIVYS